MCKQLIFKYVLLFCGVVLFNACNEKTTVTQAADYVILPQPQTLEPKTGAFVFGPGTQIILSEASRDMDFLARFLSEQFEQAAGFTLKSKVGETVGDNQVFLQLDPEFEGDIEAYTLNVDSQNIGLRAKTSQGLFYGLQSLRQLLPHAIEAKTVQKNVVWQVPGVYINDTPKFKYRGMQMDVSRHFFDVAELKSFIDRLALFKMNRFHIHLTDDQGWRLEIDRYPELTEQGAWREMNDHDRECLKRAETDPMFALPEKHFKEIDGERRYGGYYTKADMREVIDYASQRGITIVPEIDMPGHMKAALDAFSHLSCVDGAGWGHTFSIPLCPCEEAVYEFAENVLEEVVALFPGEYIHIGADEVDKSTWAQSDACKALMKKEGLASVEALQSYFVKRIEKYLNGKGKKMIGWDEVLEGGVNPSTTVMYWRGWVPNAPVEAVEKGNEVIMTPNSHCYFDYEPNDESLGHVYDFDPIPEALKTHGADKIIGLQANLWSEYIPTMDRLDYLSMPRMLAIAEVGWGKYGEKSKFLEHVGRTFDRLDQMDIRYRLPDIAHIPGSEVFIQTDTLALSLPEGIDAIRYTTDGSLPDLKSSEYTEPIVVSEEALFHLASFRKGKRVKVYRAHYKKQALRTADVLDVAPGLQMTIYKGSYRSVAQITDADKVSQSISPLATIPENADADGFGLKFEGYFKAPEDGVYTFYLTSDDGSTLQVADALVVDNDGNHGAIEKKGQIALAKGLHPLIIKYYEGSGGETLSLTYETKNQRNQRKEVTADLLYHKRD